MLVVQQRRTTVATPPVHAVPSVGPTGQKAVEEDREGMRHPRAHLWDERATEAVLEFLREIRVGCLVTMRRPPEEEEEGEDSESEEGGPGPP